MSRITTVKDKIPKKASWPGFLASGKETRTKVVLARKLEKQGLGSTPGWATVFSDTFFLWAEETLKMQMRGGSREMSESKTEESSFKARTIPLPKKAMSVKNKRQVRRK